MSDQHKEEHLGQAFDQEQIRRLLRFVAPHWKLFLGSTLILFAVFGLELLGPYLIGAAIDGPISAALGGSSMEVEQTRLIQFLALFAGVSLILCCLRYLEVILMNHTGQNVIYDIRLTLFSHIQKLSLRFLMRTPWDCW